MKHENRELSVSFVTPDAPTVRQILAYDSAVIMDASGRPTFERLWNGVPAMVTDWQCDSVRPGADLDALTDPNAAKVVEWAGLAVFAAVNALKESAAPKNS